MQVQNSDWFAPSGDNWSGAPQYNYIDTATGKQVNPDQDQATRDAIQKQFGAGAGSSNYLMGGY